LLVASSGLRMTNWHGSMVSVWWSTP